MGPKASWLGSCTIGDELVCVKFVKGRHRSAFLMDPMDSETNSVTIRSLFVDYPYTNICRFMRLLKLVSPAISWRIFWATNLAIGLKTILIEIVHYGWDNSA